MESFVFLDYMTMGSCKHTMTATATRTWQNKTQLTSKTKAQRVRFKTLQNNNVKLPEFAWTENRNPIVN